MAYGTGQPTYIQQPQANSQSLGSRVGQTAVFNNGQETLPTSAGNAALISAIQPYPSYLTPTLINETLSGSIASNTTQTMTATATPGNTLVAEITRSGGLATGALFSVTDTGGNTWQLLTRGAVSSGTNSRIEVWSCTNCVSPGTITFTSTASQTTSVNISEWSNISSIATAYVDNASLDNSAVASSNPITAPSVQADIPGVLVIAAIHMQQTTTSGLTAGWTALQDFDDGSIGSGRAAYQVVSNAGVIPGPSWTLGTAKAAGITTIALFPVTNVTPTQTGTISMDGAGDLAVSGPITEIATIGMIGAGSLTIAGLGIAIGSVPMVGAGSMTVVGNKIIQPTLNMAGTGTTTFAGRSIIQPALSMTGIGSLSISGIGIISSAISMVGVGDLSIDGSSTSAEYTAFGPTVHISRTFIAYAGDTSQVSLGTAFYTTLSGQYSSGLRFWIDTPIAGYDLSNGSFSLWISTLDGSRPDYRLTSWVSPPSGTISVSGWNTIYWPSSVPLIANTIYYVVANTTNVYSSLSFEFSGLDVAAPSGASGLYLIGEGDGSPHLNGAYLYGTPSSTDSSASSFASFQSTFYGVDPVLTTVGASATTGVVTMGGGGSLTVAGFNTEPSSISMSGTGILTIAGLNTKSGTVALTGASSLTITGIVTKQGTVGMAGTGTFNITGIISHSGITSMIGIGTLTIVGLDIESVSVGMVGIGGLNVNGLELISGTVTMTGSSSMAVLTSITKIGLVGMSGSGVLNVSSGQVATITMLGSGSLLISGTDLISGALAMIGSSSLTILASDIILSNISMIGVGTLAITGLNIISPIVVLVGSATMTITGSQIKSGAVLMLASSILAITPPVGSQSASVAMIGAGSLAVAAVIAHSYAALMTGTGILTVLSSISHSGTVALTGSSVLAIIGQISKFGSITLAGVGNLLIGSFLTRIGLINLIGSGTTTILSQQSIPGLVMINNTGSMSIGGIVIPFVYGQITMASSGVLLLAGVVLSLIQASVPMRGVGDFNIMPVVLPPGEAIRNWHDFYGGPAIPELVRAGSATPYPDYGILGGRFDT